MPDDPSLVRIIQRIVESSRGAGLDHMGQVQHAVAAVLAVRQNRTETDAMTLVNRLLPN